MICFRICKKTYENMYQIITTNYEHISRKKWIYQYLSSVFLVGDVLGDFIFQLSGGLGSWLKTNLAPLLTKTTLVKLFHPFESMRTISIVRPPAAEYCFQNQTILTLTLHIVLNGFKSVTALKAAMRVLVSWMICLRDNDRDKRVWWGDRRWLIPFIYWKISLRVNREGRFVKDFDLHKLIGRRHLHSIANIILP